MKRSIAATVGLLCILLIGPSARAAIIFDRTFGDPAPGEGTLNFPYDIAVDPTTGDIFVVDNAAFRIQKYNKKGEFLQSIGTPGTGESHLGDGQLYYPNAIAIDPTGTFLYVADTFNSRIQVFATTDGGFVRKWGTQGAGDDQLDHPTGIAVDGQGNVYVIDTRNHRVVKFSPSGAFITKWGTFGTANGQFNTPVGIEVDRVNGTVWVTEDAGRFQGFGLNGSFQVVHGVDGLGNRYLTNPDEIAIDSLGYAYVIESGGSGDGHEVSVFDLNRSGETSFVGEFKGADHFPKDYGFSPHGIFFAPDETSDSNPAYGRLFVAAGGAEGEKVFQYALNVRQRLEVRETIHIPGVTRKLEFRVEHNSMLGSCFVKGVGVLHTPQRDPVFEGEDFKVSGSREVVKAKKGLEYVIQISNRAAKAIEETRVTLDITFKSPGGCSDPTSLEDPQPVELQYGL